MKSIYLIGRANLTTQELRWYLARLTGLANPNETGVKTDAYRDVIDSKPDDYHWRVHYAPRF